MAKTSMHENDAPATELGAGRIAWMYYVEGQRQNEIAERLGIGRVTVVRTINEALLAAIKLIECNALISNEETARSLTACARR
jgi:DNA-binding transcriptional regulator LsrR (DeoR family)